MIPGKILRFLDTSAAAIAGTRDNDLVPRLHRASSWIVEPDGETFACAFPEQYTRHLISNLEANRQFTLTVCEIVSHETYQFKGEYIDSRAVTLEDKASFDAARERFAKAVNIQFPGVPDAIGRAYLLEPSVVVRFLVREIFLQTPGPGAGKRLFPPEAS